MLGRISSFFINCFSSFQSALKNIIFFLISIMVFFLTLSDRIPYNYVNFAIYVVQAILILFYVLKYGKLHFDCFVFLLITFLSVILTSQILNMSLLEFPRTILLLSIFAFLFYQFLLNLTVAERATVYKLIFLGGCFLAIFFIGYYFPRLIEFNFESRLGRELSDQNDLAKHFALFCVLGELFSFKEKGIMKLLFILATLIFFFLVLVTGSISNLLVLSIVSIALFIYMPKGKKKVLVLIVLIIIISLFIVLLQLPFMSYFKTRILNMYNTFSSNGGNVDYSFLDRFNLALYGFRLFTSKPLFGYGYDQVQFYTWGKNAFSHNNFVELLASFGIFGFILFELFLIYPIYKCWKQKGKETAVFILLYLFMFQFFLIIFRKKIEYFIIPLAFSFIQKEGHSEIVAFIDKGRIKFLKNGFYYFGKNRCRYHSIEI